MGKYEEAFSRTGEVALARLEGPGGLLAVTETHLVYVDDTGVQRLELARIRRVSRGEGGTLAVQGEGASLSIPLKAFPVEELKGFLEGLKPHVARARKATSAPQPAAAPQPAPQAPVWEEEAPPAPPRRASVELAPEPEAPAPPPEEASSAPPREASRRRNPLALPLKVLALLTLGYTVAFAALNPGADPWALAGVVLGGLGLALTEWSLATSSS